ncbi:UDP-N-acetylglucosamine 1-carboxyvinyltransferase [Candidatus Microgenomates bacterium]|nr:UDP-N-acetylglucosamine 1-carboxyvinyltransferase [Candidatus Microgenomates bacterium]
MEDAFYIQGGRELSGDVTLSGAKNLALKVIIASLMFEGKVVFQNVPRINDVTELLHLIQKLGVKTNWIETNTLEIDPTTLTSSTVDLLHASKMRVSFLLFAPLLQKFRECKIPNPGGCRLGQRPIDRIIDGLEALGAQVDYDSLSGFYSADLADEPQGSYHFPKPSHTGTELLIMFAALGSHDIVLKNCATEPEIDDLIACLNEAGAQIKRHKDEIHIKGVKSLKQQKPFVVSSDRNEAVTFAILGIASRGTVKLGPIAPSQMDTFIEYIKKTGSTVDVNGEYIGFAFNGRIKPVDIVTAPHPGFMTDWQPNWAVLMSQADGHATIHETIFENRFSYVSEMKKLGADMKFIDMHVNDPEKTYQFNYSKRRTYRQAIEITGGEPLHGGVLKIADLRAGATLLIGALIATGESILLDASTLERGYEDIVKKVSLLGGDIKRV